MWVVAGVLLGLVLVAAAAGFHSGPHVHVAAGVVGAVAAAWLLVMAATGRAVPTLWALLAVDVVVSAGAVASGWWGLAHRGRPLPAASDLEGAEGVAVGDLRPAGIVRVRGEEWSAESVNGPVRSGARVQVLRVEGVRLQVWGEEVDVEASGVPDAELPGAGGEAGGRAGGERPR